MHTNMSYDREMRTGRETEELDEQVQKKYLILEEMILVRTELQYS